ncbi:MAG: hypothetical protein Q7S87_17440 [Agitococcus sp.]|nr:hypothetical protein [Agitococcus sp.]MDO9178770.1 hypothetical protein [Agitococcus sp.]
MFFNFSLGLITLCMAMLLASSHAVAANDDDFESLRSPLGREWILTKNDRLRHIKTYVRLEDGKQFRSFKVEAVLESSMQTLSNVLFDFENYTKWYWETRESRLLQRKSNTDFIIYMVHKAPQGLPDRDVILQGVIEPQSPTKRSLALKVVALPDFLPLKPPLIRMPAEDISIKLTPIANNRIQVVAEGYFDAGGTVPVWATNFVQRAAPYSVIRNLQRMLLRDEYRNSKQPPMFPLYDYDDYVPATKSQP